MNRIFSRLSISPFHWYRLTAIPVLGLALLHFAIYKKLPFQPGYTFPWITYAIILVTGYVVCQGNCEVYKRMGGSKLTGAKSAGRFLRQFAYGWMATAAVFTALYWLQLELFDSSFDGVKFSGYLLLMLGISSLETAVLILRDFYGFLQRRKPVLTAPILERGTGPDLLNIPSGKKVLRLPVAEVAYVHSKGGIVTFYTTLGQKITSDYTALDDVEAALGQAPFFRLNRQYLVHRNAIRRITEVENRKIDVTIQPNGDPDQQFRVPVSRYKARDFKDWLHQ